MTGQALLQGASVHDGITVSLEGTSLSATTDAEGRFSLENVVAGGYTVVARKSGYIDASRAVAVLAGEAATVTLNLQQEAGSILGTVQAEGLLDASGVTVTLVETGATTTTDALGQFLLSGLAPGTYTVALQREDYLPAEQSVVVQARGATLVTILLARERGGVAGTVVLEGTSNHTGAVVTLVEAGVTATTDAQGRFLFESVMTGTYTVRARRDSYLEAQQSVEVRVNAQSQVNLSLSLVRGDVAGTVQLADGATPSGVTVTVMETGATATADAQGQFSFTGLPLGPYSLTARKAGYTDAQQSVEVRAGAAALVSFTLVRSQGRLEGTVRLEGASDHFGITVVLTETGVTTTTDAQGRFALEGVSSGHYTLTARKANYAKGEAQLNVSSGQSTSVSLSLARLGALEVSAPQLAVQGGHLALTGSGFGEERGPFTVTVGGRAVTDFISWSDTRVVVRVAHQVVPGEHDVVVTPGVPWRQGVSTSVRVLAQRTYAHSEYWGVGILPSNRVTVWGEALPAGSIQQIPEGLSDVVSVTAADNTALALKADGSVVAWGANLPGSQNVPAGLTEVVAIEAGSHFVLALKADGTVVGWGANGYQQSAVPAGLAEVVALAAGNNHALALVADGTVVAWGANDLGQATPPEGLAGVVAISVTRGSSLALLADGTVVPWGGLYYENPEVPDVDDIVAIAGGEFHILALRSNGTVVAWGNNDDGVSTPPATLGSVAAVSGRAMSLSMVLRSDGRLVFWGDLTISFWLPSSSLVLRVPAL